MEEKKKRVIYITPIGVAGFCALTEPNTKFNKAGVYQVLLFLDNDKAAELLSKLEAEYSAAVANGKEKWEKEKIEVRKKNPFKENAFYDHEYDENERETGRIKLSFKHMASGISKDGREWRKSIPLFDSAAKPLKVTPDTKIFSGSELRVSFSVVPYYVAATGCGISLRLEGVQVLKAVSSGRSAESLGFSAVDGYENEQVSDSGESSFGDNEEKDVDF